MIRVPPKLASGDRVAVVAPSRSMSIVSSDVRARAGERMSDFGLQVVCGSNVEESDRFGTSSIDSRLMDFHDAFNDPGVRGILTAIGGYSCNQLLNGLDFETLAAHPKVLCGFSDITVLQNAVYSSTGLITYSGPHFSSFGMLRGLEYTLRFFDKCVFKTEPFLLEPSPEWSDDRWWIDQDSRTFFPNDPGHQILQPGECYGRLVGGNLSSLTLLCGTAWFPNLAGSVLLLEDEGNAGGNAPMIFDRLFQSLAHQRGFESLAGILIGRPTKAAPISTEELADIVLPRLISRHVPVIANIDVGHTTPIATLPIGGTVRVRASAGRTRIEVIEH